MSRGAGKIERAIEALFQSDETGAYLVNEIAQAVWPGEIIERKHLVSVRRAAPKVAARMDWDTVHMGRKGGAVAYYNPYNVMSYALARLKSNWLYSMDTEDQLRKRIAPEGRDRELVEPGGALWRFTEIRIAERNGDTTRVKELEAEVEAELGKASARFKEIMADV